MTTDLTLSNIVIIIGCILVALTVHEAMHAFVGLKLGDDTAAEEGRISLNPLRHIDPFTTLLLPIITLLIFHAPILAAKPVPFNPARVKYDEFGGALIALAGPVSNLVLAFIGAFLLRTFTGNESLYSIFSTFVVLNVALFVFNLLPIPPLDGSRVLYAFAPEPVQQFMQQIELYGIFIVFGLVLLSGFGNVIAELNQSVLRLLL